MPLTRGQGGGILGAIGVCGLFIALSVNNLSGYSYYDGQGNITEKCEWNKICLNSDITPEFCFKFSECLNYFGVKCNDAKAAGQTYLGTSIIALFIGFIATLGCFARILNPISKFIGLIYLLCCLFCIIGASHWIYEGDKGQTRCYDPSISHSYLGASIILLWICMIIFLFAGIFTWNKKPITTGQPLISNTIIYTQTQNIGVETAQ